VNDANDANESKLHVYDYDLDAEMSELSSSSFVRPMTECLRKPIAVVEKNNARVVNVHNHQIVKANNAPPEKKQTTKPLNTVKNKLSRRVSVLFIVFSFSLI
jgi:hypothetical protein